MQHTHIPVMYRDGANYKSYGTIVLEGAISPTQIVELRRYLSENGFGTPQFKPLALGMAHHAYGEGSWNDDHDHPWHDALLDDIEIVEGPQCFGDYIERPGTVGEFIAAVKKQSESGWGED